MVTYSPAEKKDCGKLAEMINIASDGVVEFLFHNLIDGMTPVQVVAYNLEADYYPHTYKNVMVAVDDDEIVGMSLSYPSSFHKITDEMKNFFPPDRLEHLSHFYASRVENSYFIDTLCVVKSHRRRGIGEKLISLVKEQAVKNGYNTLSLIAFADNNLAIPVYEHTGFEIVQKVKLQRNEFIPHDEGCLLMKCNVHLKS